MQLVDQEQSSNKEAVSPAIYAALVYSLFQNPAPMFAGALCAASGAPCAAAGALCAAGGESRAGAVCAAAHCGTASAPMSSAHAMIERR